MDGESGCGKSALVAAALAPTLRTAGGLLPVLIRDWGDDWIRGPLAAALDALYAALNLSERERIGWCSAPDLAADRDVLKEELERRLAEVNGNLNRRTLLIADQFDDYQSQAREQFIDETGNWLPPQKLAERNVFWELVSRQLRQGSLHLLAVTRSDTASGLSCVRFLDASMIADRQLARVEMEHLRPLLAGIAPNRCAPC